MSNHGNYIVSLGNVCRWLGKPKNGVEIYPGFAATEVLYNDEGAVIGVATGDMGVDATDMGRTTRGMALLGKYAGRRRRARLACQAADHFKFKLDEGREPAKYGIGLKELWQVDRFQAQAQGLVQHSFGWPLDMKTGGGWVRFIIWKTIWLRSVSCCISTS